MVLFALLALACEEAAPPDAIRASGHVEATEVRLAPDAGGRIVELAVQEGAPMRVGDVVVRLDQRDVELSLQRARAEHGAAVAQLRLLEAGARREDIRQAEA